MRAVEEGKGDLLPPGSRDPVSQEHTSDNRQLFDRYAEEYQALLSRSVSFFGEGAEYFARYKLERILRLCGSSSPVHILDIGCGVGLLTELLRRALPSTRVTGLDLSPKSLDQAASRCAGLGNVVWCVYDGNTLPPGVEGADLVVLANVLHHVEPAARAAFLEGVVLPALLPGSRVVIFEHNPYNPMTRLAVRLCPFDQDARLLSRRTATALLRRYRLRVLQWDYIVFFPRLLRFLRGLEGRMGRLPVGGQYMVVGQWDPFPEFPVR